MLFRSRGPKVPDPGSCFQRPRIFGYWLMFSEDQGFFGLWLMFLEDQRFWILAHVFKGLGFWGFSSRFQRTKSSGSWLMFLKANDFWILVHVFRGPKVLDPSTCFQRPRNFLDLGLCF